mgnify:CR=1 FL=1
MELLTVLEAAKLLKIDRKTLYKFIKSGDIPAIRIGTQWRIPVEELDIKIRNSQKGKHQNEKGD